jgi:hypothetical protein
MEIKGLEGWEHRNKGQLWADFEAAFQNDGVETAFAATMRADGCGEMLGGCCLEAG